jgi:hypothetical protein
MVCIYLDNRLSIEMHKDVVLAVNCSGNDHMYLMHEQRTAVPLVSNIISIFNIMKSLMSATSCQPISSDLDQVRDPEA